MSRTTQRMMVVVGAVLCLTGWMIPLRADEVTAPVPAPPEPPPEAPAMGNQPEENQKSNKWEFVSPLYFWIPGVHGNASVNGHAVNVNVDPGDIIRHTDFGFQGYFALQKPEYGFYLQPTYLKLSGDGNANGVRADAEMHIWIIESAGFYRIWNSESDRPASLYALAGVRWWNLHNTGTIHDPAGNINVGSSMWLLDPIVGLRFKEYLTKRLSFLGQADVGGFDISSDSSRFTWQFFPVLGYDFTMPVIRKPSTVFAGYRWLSIQKFKGSGASERGAHITLDGVLVGLNVNLF